MVSRYLIFCTSCPRCFFFCTASLIRKCFPLTHYFRFKLYIIFNKKRDIEFSNSCPVTVEHHGCVHLILKDSTWGIVRLGWFTAATGLSLCFLIVHSHITPPFHIPYYGILFPFQTIYTLPQKAVCTIFFEKI